MARPEHYAAAIRAHRDGQLGVNWGMSGAIAVASWAQEQGWDIPNFFGIKKAFIKRMLQSEADFELALVQSGIDVYLPDGYSDHD